MVLNPKELAERLAKVAEYLALARNPSLPEAERVHLLNLVDLLLDECENSGMPQGVSASALSKGQLN